MKAVSLSNALSISVFIIHMEVTILLQIDLCLTGTIYLYHTATQSVQEGGEACIKAYVVCCRGKLTSDSLGNKYYFLQ